MTDDDIELAILKRAIAQYAEAERVDPDRGDKCLREIDLGAALGDLTGKSGSELAHLLQIWFVRLAPRRPLSGHRAPLRPCSNSRRNAAEHRYHVRAYLDASRGSAPAWDRIRELERSRTGESAGVASGMSKEIIVFISHSSADVELAARLIDLLRTALNLPGSVIRCTSVDGYRLPGGADTNEQLRREVHDAEAFLGIVSASSLRSLYVLFELGARWGAKKHLMPVLSPGTSPDVLGGPLSGLNALRTDSRGQLHQIVTDLARVLDTNPESPARYEKHITGILEMAPSAPDPATKPAGGVQKSARWARVPRLPRQNDDVSTLSLEARELLLEASRDQRGEVFVVETNTGLQVSTNGREFVETGNARSEAKWRRALKALQDTGLIESRGGDGSLLAVTDEGFRVADQFLEDEEATDPHMGRN